MWTDNLNFKYLAFTLLWFFQITAGQRMPNEHFLQGIAMLQQEKYDSALIAFTISKGLNEKDPMSWYNSGMVYYTLKNNQEALNNFFKAEKLDPGGASLMIAKTYAREMNVNKVLEYLDIHLKSRNKIPENQILSDPDFLPLENNKDWIAFWRDNSYYTPFDQLLAEARYMIKSEEYTEAINLLSEGLKRGYRAPALLAERASVYKLTGNDQLAVKDMNDAIDQDRRNTSLYISRGDLHYRQGNYRQSVADFSTAISQNPEQFDLYLKRARAYGKEKALEEAKSDMEFYLKYFPENDEAWYEYGKIHMEVKKYLDALRCLNKAISLDQTDARYFLARGESYYHASTFKYAGNDLSMSLDLDPENSDAYFYRGLTALKLGEKELACFCFKKAYQYGKKEAFNYIGENCRQ